MLGQLLAGDRKLDKLAWDDLVAALEQRGLAASFHHDDDTWDGTYDDENDSRVTVEAVKAIAKRVTLSATAFAWHSRHKHDRYAQDAFLREIANALSHEKIAMLRLVVADKTRHVVVLVTWADRAPAVAAAKAAGHRIIPLGPQRPRAKPSRPARALPVTVKQVSTRWGDRVHDNLRLESLVLTTSKHTTERLDFSTWPPKRSVVAPYHANKIAFLPDGGFVASGFTGDGEKHLRYFERRSATGAATALEMPGTDETIQIDRLGFVDGDIVLCPFAWCYQGKHVARPLICRRGERTFAEIAELPAAKVIPSSAKAASEPLRQGFARTGGGAAVLLWNDSGYVREGAKLVERFTLPKGPLVWSDVSTAPADGEAFFAVSDRAKLFEIRAGEKPRRRLHAVDDADTIVPGPEGVVLVRLLRRTPKLPLFVAWWPARREYASVGMPLFGYGKAAKCGFHDHGYASASGLVWGFDSIAQEVRAIAWEAIAALPRTAET